MRNVIVRITDVHFAISIDVCHYAMTFEICIDGSNFFASKVQPIYKGIISSERARSKIFLINLSSFSRHSEV